MREFSSVCCRVVLLSITALGGCRDASKPVTAQDEDAYPLLVIYPSALREAASEKSRELDQLSEGVRLYDVGVVSDFLASINLHDTLRQEPWVRVRTRDGKSGWVFAGALRPPAADEQQSRAWLLDKRFQALFGPALTHRWRAWQQTPAPATDTACAQLLRGGLALRDSMNLLISRVLSRDESAPLPDLFWLGELSPYFVVQHIMGGKSYYLFLDFRAISRTAGHTAGDQDDRFSQMGFAAFPADSIESALPVWVFPLSADESCSNLGQGQHLKLLRKIDTILAAGDLFRPELLDLKDRILNDILDKDRDYWQPREKILQEMNALIGSPPHCLSAGDIIALKARQNMFEQSESTGIRLNLRTGK